MSILFLGYHRFYQPYLIRNSLFVSNKVVLDSLIIYPSYTHTKIRHKGLRIRYWLMIKLECNRVQPHLLCWMKFQKKPNINTQQFLGHLWHDGVGKKYAYYNISYKHCFRVVNCIKPTTSQNAWLKYSMHLNS